MATLIRSQQQLYDLWKLTVQSEKPELTDFSDGAINDILAGVGSHAVSEAIKVMLDEFKKTFIDSAEGPEATGGADDLETLATDHFGDTFERPDAQEAIGVANFTRPNADAGDVTISLGAIVKTPTDAGGESQSYETLTEVVMTGTAINASIQAVEAGPKGNQDPGAVTIIETTLTDPSVVVTNSAEIQGGAVEQDDATYRETIKDLVLSLRGATKVAVEGAARAVPGIEFATALELKQPVKEWDVGTDLPVGDVFRIPRVKMYIADANGVANQALIDLVEAAIFPVKACGVRIDVISGVGLALDWSAEITLNPSGPNFATLSVDPQPIMDSMEEYIAGLPIGADFDRTAANAAILAIWGPSGTDDLTAFVTTIPSGDVDADDDDKLTPGTIDIV